jgi:glycosyltransferase involved in cell wall biosynthesis
VNEAMASGVPALVSRYAGCSVDLVVEGRTGHAFDCGDVNALSRLIASLAAEPARARAMGEGAAKHIERFSVDAAAAGVLAACWAGAAR